jgi:hypothetical protein
MNTADRIGELLQNVKNNTLNPNKALASLCEALEDLRTELYLSQVIDEDSQDPQSVEKFREHLYVQQKDTRIADLIFHYNKKYLLEYSPVVRYNIVTVLVRIIREREGDVSIPTIWYQILDNNGNV